MIATYEPTQVGKRLNVREKPRSDAKVVRTMEAGSERAVAVECGWVKLADGYADARFMTVTEDAHEAEPAAEPEKEPEAEPEPQASEPDGEDEARARLKKMTNPQLYKLAQDSGIKVAKGSTKAELVEAILNGADE